MRVLLASSNFCIEPYRVYPLSISVLAGALSEAGHQVRQFDPAVYGENHLAELEKAVDEFQPELIGVSIRNLDLVDSRNIDDQLLSDSLKFIRAVRAMDRAPLLLGGAGFSLYPDELLKLTGAEYGIAGEGEEATLELLEEIAAARALPGVRHGRPGRQARAVYDPVIAEFYHRECHILPVQTKRGCALRCSYCTYPALEGRLIRERELEEVLEDIAGLHEKYPDAMIYFVDAIFNDPERRFVRLTEELIRRKLNIHWSGFITPGYLRDGDLELMVESGLISADLGIDAGSDATLRGICKPFSFDAVRDCCRKLQALSIGVTGSVMFGGPGETYGTIAEGIDNLLSLESAYISIFSGIRLLRGAPMLELAQRENRIPPDWNGIGSLFYFAPGLDPEKVHEQLKRGFEGNRHCIYPPASRNADLRLLHAFGYSKLHKLQLTGGGKR